MSPHRWWRVICPVVLCVTGLSVQAEDLPPAAAPVIDVTLYSHQARLVRAVAVTDAAGVQEITVGPLPATLVDQSVQVVGDQHLRVIGVQIDRHSGAGVIPEEVRAVDRQLKALQRDRDRAHRRQLQAKERFDRFLRLELTPPPRSVVEPKPFPVDASGWENFLQLVRKGLEAAAADIEAQRAALEKLDKEWRALYGRRTELGAPHSKTETLVHITYQNLNGKAGQLRLVHHIPAATWRPAYVVHIDPQSKRAVIDVYAEVQQHTGEDWPQVPLHFSTSVPEDGAGLPELVARHISRERFRSGYTDGLAVDTSKSSPNFLAPRLALSAADEEDRRPARKTRLDGRQGEIRLARRAADPARDSVAKKKKMAAEHGVAGFDRYSFSMQGAPRAQRAPSVVELARGFIRTFHSTRPEAVPADGRLHRLNIARLELPYSLRRTLHPELKEHVFRTLVARVSGDDPVIAGVASVFYGNSYLGQSLLPTTAPTEELTIALGVDDRIRVERIQHDREEEIGVFAKATRYLTRIEVKIKNFHDEQIEIELAERIPFTDAEQVSIALIADETRPRPVEVSESSGLVRWKLQVAAASESEVRLAYAIEAPVDRQLTQTLDPDRKEVRHEK